MHRSHRKIRHSLATLAALFVALLGVAVAVPAQAQTGTNPVVQSVSAWDQTGTFYFKWRNGQNGGGTWDNGGLQKQSHVKNNGTRPMWVLVQRGTACCADRYLGQVDPGEDRYLPLEYSYAGQADQYLRIVITRKSPNGAADCAAYIWIAPKDSDDQSNSQNC